ncbi:MAG: hypothetical protein HZA84_03640 [Thaumarchaeota archaeon]|nr:hypothetical protein [Nitrososphaerota archaeon]
MVKYEKWQEPNVTHDDRKKLNSETPLYHSNEVPAEGTDSMGKNTVQNITNNTAKIQTTSRKQTKKGRLLAHVEVRRWYDNLARGSGITAEVKLRRLSWFCEQHEISPMQFAELGMKDLKAATDLVQDNVTWMEKENYAPGYIAETVKGVKSWLQHFDVQIKRKIRIANIGATPTLENEKVPEPLELAELFNRSDMRSGAMMSLIAKSGLRPEVLGNYRGTDGLRIKDLPDLAIVQGLATFMQTPPRIVVRKNLSKARHEYFTFTTDIGGKKLLAYINSRTLAGESMSPDTPVIAPETWHENQRGNNNGKKFLPTSRIEEVIRNTMRPRFSWRPYLLRAFFDTELLISESRGRIAHDFRVFFMGHKGSIEARYTTNKSILPKALMDEMRESFKRSEEFLDLEKSAEDPLEKKRGQVKETVGKLSVEQLAEVQMFVSNLADCKTNSELSFHVTQNN